MSGILQTLFMAASSAIKDAYFNYVTLLLHGDGTNGAQNNTFLDSSTNNFTITRNGNTTQGTFTPYGSNWSNYFGSSSDYLSCNPGANAAFGTGDFTVEAWVFATGSLSSGDNPYICDTRGGGGAWNFSWNWNGGANPWQLAWANSSALQSTTAMTINTWNHCVYVRSGTTGTLYLNGVSVGTWTDSFNYSASVTSMTIARRYTLTTNIQYLQGYLSNLRIVKGTAVYTAAFTPPTAPLTAITNTSLLTCQSNRFIDNSTNALAISTGGSPSIQRFSPFSPTDAYSPSVIGGSGYFVRASSQYLTASNSSGQFSFGTDAFTIECWVNLSSMPSGTGYPASYWLFGGGPTNSDTGIDFYINNTQIGFNLTAFSLPTAIGNHGISINSWYHVVVVRGGTSNQTLSLYINGTRVATASSVTATADAASTGISISAAEPSGATGGNFDGYISNYRIVKGTAVYDPTSSTLTVPTAPVTAITNTALLCNFTNAGIYDNAEMNDLETVGNAQVSTSVVKFGSGSMYFDGSSYLYQIGTPNLVFGAGDFTIELWLNISGGVGGTQTIIAYGATATIDNKYWSIEASGSNLAFYGPPSATQYFVTTSQPWTSGWAHIAVCRSGSNTRLFVNGTQQGSTYTTLTNFDSGGNLFIGTSAYSTSRYMAAGYIDDIRITKGYARYTANFTPPTAAFPNQ